MPRGSTSYPAELFVAAILLLLIKGLTTGAIAPNYMERWDDGSRNGWHLLDDSSGTFEDGRLIATNGFLEFVCPATTNGSAGKSYSILAQSDSSAGRFAGDYFDASATVLRFDLYASHDTIAYVWLWNQPEFLMYKKELSLSTGWQSFAIPLDTDCFSPDFGGSGSPEEFALLLSAVDTVQIQVERASNTNQQNYGIDNVLVKGCVAGYAVWAERWGGSFSNRLPVVDYDGDTVSSSDEYVADTDPVDASDYFAISILDAPLRIAWESSSNRIYKVFARSNLTSNAFSKVSGDIAGDGGIECFDIDAGNRSSCFKVEVEIP